MPLDYNADAIAITDHMTALRCPYDRWKSVIDVTGALVGLVLAAPVLLVVSIVIRLDDPGPVIFRQKRTGLNGKHFTMYKFRTMVRESPNVSTEEMIAMGCTFNTRCGKLLRKASLDELPQLWNILRGEMSFVGPRPALFNQYELIAKREAAGVHAVKPGITGWAQVNGRDDIEDDAKVQLDAEYVRRRCLALDARIIWRTFVAVVSSRGNY